jgi:hypothetical protein
LDTLTDTLGGSNTVGQVTVGNENREWRESRPARPEVLFVTFVDMQIKIKYSLPGLFPSSKAYSEIFFSLDIRRRYDSLSKA